MWYGPCSMWFGQIEKKNYWLFPIHFAFHIYNFFVKSITLDSLGNVPVTEVKVLSLHSIWNSKKWMQWKYWSTSNKNSWLRMFGKEHFYFKQHQTMPISLKSYIRSRSKSITMSFWKPQENMNLIIRIIIFVFIENISADSIGWNRLSNSINQQKRTNANQPNDYNGQMLRHLKNQDERTFQKFLKFLRNQNRLALTDPKWYSTKYHQNR